MKLQICTSMAVGLLLCMSGAAAQPNPLYSAETGTLTIEAADSVEMPGLFQDVTVEFSHDDMWRLTNIREGVTVKEIEKVELIRTETFPVQVFLRISGTFPHGCPQLGLITSRLVGNTFEVAVYYRNNAWLQNPEVVLCTQAMVPFEAIHPLPVYALEPGIYSYSVNDEFNGSFELTVSNNID